MSIFLLPFKLLAVPAKAIAGFIGVFIIACIYAVICHQLLCWAAWNFGWTSVGAGWLAITTIGAFVLTFVAAYD